MSLRVECLKALRAIDAQAITSARFIEWVREAAGEYSAVGCDCCDHPLQHLIHRVIARYEAPIPPPTHSETIQALRHGLQDWEDSQ